MPIHHDTERKFEKRDEHETFELKRKFANATYSIKKDLKANSCVPSLRPQRRNFSERQFKMHVTSRVLIYLDSKGIRLLSKTVGSLNLSPVDNFLLPMVRVTKDRYTTKG
ncbi:hypothetical protein TNCV_3342951 [Trichonephila clavipes]|nr:hypothetical protein TNCV_3342951 [Trichonephila clavipes]